VGIGSNLGDRRQFIDAAISALSQPPHMIRIRSSAVVETEPWGVLDQPAFLNAIVELHTTLSPFELLQTMKSIEQQIGRTPSEKRWGPRQIDLDILLFDDLILDTTVLTIPHPRLTARKFVLSQLAQLDADLLDPHSGRRLLDFLENT